MLVKFKGHRLWNPAWYFSSTEKGIKTIWPGVSWYVIWNFKDGFFTKHEEGFCYGSWPVHLDEAYSLTMSDIQTLCYTQIQNIEL